MAKDFSTIDTGNREAEAAGQEESRLSAEIQKATRKTGQQGTAPEEEAAERAAARKTQGRKGVKQPRINLALSTLNLDYVTTMARMVGVPRIDFINNIIDRHRETHGAEFETAKKFLARLDGGTLPNTPEEAEAFITENIEKSKGVEPGTYSFAEAVNILLQEYLHQKEQAEASMETETEKPKKRRGRKKKAEAEEQPTPEGLPEGPEEGE